MSRIHSLTVVVIGVLALVAGKGLSAEEHRAAHDGRLTLAEAVERAQMTNPELRAAAQEVEIARGMLVKARYPSQFNPQIGGDGAHRSRSGRGGSGSATDYGVALSQEIEVAGQRGARIAEAEQAVARAEAEVRDRERLLDADVKQAFFAVLVGARRVQLLERIEELDRRVREAAVARAKAGETSVIEANLAAIRYGEARKATLDAGAELTATRAALRRLLNLDPSAPLEPTGDLRDTAVPLTTENAIARALEARPDLMAAGREVDRVEADRTLTRRLAVPNPTIEAFYRKEDIEPNRIAGAGLRIPLPVFDRKQGELVALAGRRDAGPLRGRRGPPPDRAGGRGVAAALRGCRPNPRGLRAGRAQPRRRELRLHRRPRTRRARSTSSSSSSCRTIWSPPSCPTSTRWHGSARPRSTSSARSAPRCDGRERMRRRTLTLLVPILLGAACGSSPEAPASRTAEPARSPSTERVALSAEALRTTAIATVPVEQRPLTNEIRATAVIQPNENRLAHVSPPIPGRAIAVKAVLGDQVEPRQVLALLDSLELGEKKSAFLQARTNLDVARRNYEREAGLFKQRISSEKDYLETKGEFERSDAAYRAAREALRLVGLTDADIDAHHLGRQGRARSRTSRSWPRSTAR